jgi:hypothetical protein
VTGWRASLRLPRDYYLRRDTNDYSVDPAVIGRRIEVVAHPQRVRAFCDGKLVAVRERVWARRQRPPLARQRVQGEVDVLVCRVQVERGTDPTSANGRPYPSRREHYCKLPQPGHRKEMASIPWGKGIEAIVFHTIVDERRVITIHASRGALGGRPAPAAGATCRDGMSVSVSLSPPRPPGRRLRRPMLARPAVLGPRSRAPLSS